MVRCMKETFRTINIKGFADITEVKICQSFVINYASVL